MTALRLTFCFHLFVHLKVKAPGVFPDTRGKGWFGRAETGDSRIKAATFLLFSPAERKIQNQIDILSCWIRLFSFTSLLHCQNPLGACLFRDLNPSTPPKAVWASTQLFVFQANLKRFMEHVHQKNVEKVSKWLEKGLDPNFHDSDSGGEQEVDRARRCPRSVWFLKAAKTEQ